ncbi:MAG: NAD-dependent epimerase/dehydratase family protein [Candidatus Levybacteria bacterium]|nr:NAD-dependent epimerase/dehydratase family protein [Candidatus Levybacteria bacterium]
MINVGFWKNKKILVTGGKGFVGSHVIDNLIKKRKVNPSDIVVPDSSKFDLRLFDSAKRVVRGIDIVLHLAADVGGIGYSSSHPATQMRNCFLMDANIFEAAAKEKVQKFVCVSSAVAYPVDAISPLNEKDLFKGEPAKGGYGYGFAKRMSVVMTRAYKEEKGLNACVLLSANSYGPRQDFDLESGHVIPSLIRKCFTFERLEVWGDGSQIRDFFYVKDFAEGIVLAAEKLEGSEPVNIGSGSGTSIKELVKLIVRLTGFKDEVYFDTTKPQGQKIRVVDINRARKLMGFKPKYSLEKGLLETISWYKKSL